ncbi:hypothetical protein HD554DRAFT_1512315 [Boletus coccyginus]|nr:hypothetical protein HD554DRAFT_1512315 [Boletus coccyginus]
MDNPWATADDHAQETCWFADTTQWPAAERTVWLQDLQPSGDATSLQDRRARDSLDPVPDAILPNVAPVASVSDEKDSLNPPNDDWGTAWTTAPSSEISPEETQPPDQRVAARQEKEKLDCAVPPELLDSLLRHCQEVSQEIWPASETNNGDNWRSGFDGHADAAALLAQLVPTNLTLPPAVQFSTTATAKALNEALKLTRHLSTSADSPLSRLLASKGSLEWEKSIKAKQDITSDKAHVGWRVLEKEDRLSISEESKPRSATGGFLSFWNRRASAIQAAPVETPSERSSSPARSSLENAPHPSSSRVASPSKPPTPAVPPLPPTDSHPTVIATALPPSAVSRFLNRFSRTKGAQHSSLALSSDDLEFLSDIVPSANDPLDEDIDGSALGAPTGASKSSPLPPKLPPPIPPPPKQPMPSGRPPSAIGPGTPNGVSMTGNAPTLQMQAANYTPNVPVLAPPLSPRPPASFPLTQSPPLSLKDVAAPTVASGQSSKPSVQQRLHQTPSNTQPNSRPQSSLTLLRSQNTPPLLPVPPLLPPPPVSPPQTPRPSIFSSLTTPGDSSTTRNTDTSSFHDFDDFDDEFSAFTSFPPSAPAPSPSPHPSQRSPSPPSPPPRRTYERTHYPSSSSTSSTLSPTSQTSLDQLRSSISASLDGFDDFVSPPRVVRGENRKRTPSPPPLPVKPHFQCQQPLRVDTLPSRVYHAHTPSQTFASPTVHTSLMNSTFPAVSVTNADHQRTQSLVNRAAARGGTLWPNSPDSDEPRVNAIPPPPPSSTSPKPSGGEESFNLLDDGDTFSGGLEAVPAPLCVVGGIKMDSTMSFPAVGSSHTSFGVAGGPGKGLGSRNKLQPSPPPLPSTSALTLSFSSLATPVPLAATNTGSLQPARPKQTGGLSAQDLSFFEGL